MCFFIFYVYDSKVWWTFLFFLFHGYSCFSSIHRTIKHFLPNPVRCIVYTHCAYYIEKSIILFSFTCIMYFLPVTFRQDRMEKKIGERAPLHVLLIDVSAPTRYVFSTQNRGNRMFHSFLRTARANWTHYNMNYDVSWVDTWFSLRKNRFDRISREALRTVTARIFVSALDHFSRSQLDRKIGYFSAIVEYNNWLYRGMLCARFFAFAYTISTRKSAPITA